MCIFGHSGCNKAHKMLLYTILACFVLGIATEDEITKQSSSSLYPDELEPFAIPDAEMLPIVCPKVLEYLDCEEEQVSEENLHTHPIFTGVKDVVTGICEKDSKLQKNYLANGECFRHFDNNVPPCSEAAMKIYLDYRLFITRFDAEEIHEEYSEEDDKEESITYDEPYCMMSAYAVGCLGTNILDRCGQAAQETFVEIIQRSKILTQYCPKEEGHKLRSEFLDFLAFEKHHPHIGIFREIFDFRRKR